MGWKDLLKEHLKERHAIVMEGALLADLSETHGLIHNHGSTDHTHPRVGTAAERLRSDVVKDGAA